MRNKLRTVDNGCGYDVYFGTVNLGTVEKKDDGFYVFWPDDSKKGYWDSFIMRLISDELDKFNQPIQEAIGEYFNEQSNSS